MLEDAEKQSWLKTLWNNIEVKAAIKTGIAASLSLFFGLAFSRVFQRPDTLVSGLWCVLATIVVLQTQLGGTYKAASVRFIGVAIGSLIGSVFAFYFAEEYPANLGVAIFMTIVICSLLNLKDSFRIASLSTAVVIIFTGLHPALNPWVFSLFRFLDSCIGIIVAVFVAHVLWPERAGENLRDNVVKILGLLSKQYRIVADLHREAALDFSLVNEIGAEIQELSYQNINYLEESKLELQIGAKRSEEWVHIMAELDVMIESVAALKSVRVEILTKIFDDSLFQLTHAVIHDTEASFHDLEKMLDIQKIPNHCESLRQNLVLLNQDLLRFRSTRTTRKFGLEDVESFFVFFYRLRAIGESILKMQESITKMP